MFTPEDLEILKQPGSWEKVYAIQETFFPKLGALQVAANKLIYEIYRIDVNRKYKISQTPTISSRKGQVYSYKRLSNSNYILVGLRAKGKPVNLRKSDGKLCDFHFAILAFYIDLFGEGYRLTIHFSPYFVRYLDEHRFDLATSVVLHDLVELLLEFGDCLFTSHDLPTAFELFQQHKIWLQANDLDLLHATQEDLAKLVIAFVACFPMLDLFTRISNGEIPYTTDGDDFFPINQPNYAELFRQWHQKTAVNYIKEFHVEPIIEEDSWKAEATTRSIFEELIGRQFPKTRPSWLKSGRSQASLELDGYCEELSLAFEYQGEYHYMEIPIHHQSRSLKDVQNADELKLKLCQKHGVDLIQVPYWEKANREYIVRALLALDRPEIQEVLRPII